MTHRRLCLAPVLLLLPLLAIGAGQGGAGPRVERGLTVPMRDGVKLVADVYLPAGRGPWPVILMRTPYNRAAGEGAAQPFREHYAVVVQDTRGRYESGGEFSPFFSEVNDGYDTVEWAAAQPWSNGQVGMTGGSYLGIVQVLAAIARPPHLKAIFPIVTPSDFYGDTVFTGGALRQELFQGWMALMAASVHPPSSAAPGFDPSRLGELWKHRPLRDSKPVEAGGPAYVRAWDSFFAHPYRDSFWDPIRVPAQFDQVQAPAFFVGGWYDIFGPATVVNFRGWRDHGGSPSARGGTRMLIGPWTHGVNGPAGDLDPGPIGRVDLNALSLRWFDHWLRGVDNGIEREPPVHVFALGANEWRDYPDWPPPGARSRRLFLIPDPGGDLHGGSLTLTRPHGKSFTRFRYDPADPVPTTGGPTFLVPAGQKDQRAVEERPDVALFSTPALKQDVEITGEVTARLFVRSSEPDTDFTAKLVAVQPDGRAVNILDGIRRLRTYRSYDRPRQVTPGREVPLEIDLGATDAVFHAGWRIRLEVSSSNFPRFDRNPNTGAPFGTDTELRTADNEILHDATMSSSLTLPIRSGRL
jgi:putative CocE/NonD family hydrolase